MTKETTRKLKYKAEMKHVENLKMILQNSNSSLIRLKENDNYVCNFCSESYPEPKDLKSHFLQEHSDIQTLKMPRLFEYVVKVDITDLKCKMCQQEFVKLDDFSTHLNNTHGISLHTDICNEIVPFKFASDEFRCAVCDTGFLNFKILLEHMHVHFRNYICELCNAGFITRRLLVRHRRRHAKGDFKCNNCEKTFTCDQKRRDHEQRMHLGIKKRNKCKFCEEKFDDYWAKKHHMVLKHGAPPIILKCQACERTFTNKRCLTRHVKKDHLMERQHVCGICNTQFFLKHCLVEHMRAHTGVKKFQCHVCGRYYATKKSLGRHLRSHADDREYSCEVCGLAFVQRCTLKRHIRAKHEVHV